MHFASPPPWWLAVLVAAAIAGVAFFSYRRPLAPLTIAQRAVLTGLRGLALAWVALLLCRPVVFRPPAADRDGVVVPVVVDVSRSMRVPDADGQARIARAATLLTGQLLPALADRFTVEISALGDTLTPATVDALSADAGRTDIGGTLAAVRERYRDRRVAGIVLLSDGGDTGESGRPSPSDRTGPPIFAVGMGSPDGVRDREVTAVTAGDPRLDQASVDLRVSAVSRGFGRAPFDIRVLANGQLLESRHVVPPNDRSPVEEVFTVSPDPLIATVYTASVVGEGDEAIAENNTRGVLVSPAGRRRRVLALFGAPAHEHSFMLRALALDSGLEVDSVVRKGRNEAGQNTFLVQAGPGRGEALAAGFPVRADALYRYDALIIGNVEADFFTRAQLDLATEFVAERGGGLLVLGGRSFAQRGLIGTPLEPALPLELSDRRGALPREAIDIDPTIPHNGVVLTPEAENHPVMRLGQSAADTHRLWSGLPALAAVAALGGPRPGAEVLAVTTGPSGAVYPLVAVQRYGSGRSMIFAGEASWRWRMLQPATDQTYEHFWRQAIRWLAAPAPDQVSIAVPTTSEPGDSIEIGLQVRDAGFVPVSDATLEATLTSPGGDSRSLALRPEAGADGRFASTFRPTEAGLYHVRAEARKGPALLGTADRWLYVGGANREFADPRLNEGFLSRLARASGGRYVRAADASQVVSWLQSAVPQTIAPERRDLWHEPWAFVVIVVLLSAEWTLRRRWGLR